MTPAIRTILLGGAPFRLSSLFSAGQAGLWYGTGLTEGYQDSAGTTALTAPGQGTADCPEGLVLDKSRGLVLGTELVTNGDFAANVTGWTASGAGASVSFDAGTLKITAGAGGYGQGGQGITTVVGKAYKVTFDITASNQFSVYAQAGTVAGGSQNGQGTFVATATGLSLHFVASATTTYVSFQTGGVAGCTLNIDNISVKELPGLHSLQATAAARPVVSARVNLLIQTEAFNTSWAVSNVTVTANTTVAPTGELTADTLTATAGLGTVSQASIPCVGAMPIACAVSFLKTTVATTFPLIALAGTGGSIDCQVFLNTNTGVATNRSSGASLPANVNVVDQGAFWRLRFNTTTDASTTSAKLTIYPAASSNGTTLDAAATGAVVAWGAEVTAGTAAVATTYQSVTTASTYNTSGWPLLRRHDGIDDGTATAAFAAGTLTSNMDFFCVVRRESAAKGIISSNSASGNFFCLFDPAGGGASCYGTVGTPTFFVNGVAAVATRAGMASALPVGQTCVLEVRNVDLSAWDGFGMSNYATFPVNGSFGDTLLCTAQTDAVRAKIRRDLASRYGIQTA
jgi:hypothetical protein